MCRVPKVNAIVTDILEEIKWLYNVTCVSQHPCDSFIANAGNNDNGKVRYIPVCNLLVIAKKCMTCLVSINHIFDSHIIH